MSKIHNKVYMDDILYNGDTNTIGIGIYEEDEEGTRINETVITITKQEIKELVELFTKDQQDLKISEMSYKDYWENIWRISGIIFAKVSDYYTKRTHAGDTKDEQLALKEFYKCMFHMYVELLGNSMNLRDHELNDILGVDEINAISNLVFLGMCKDTHDTYQNKETIYQALTEGIYCAIYNLIVIIAKDSFDNKTVISDCKTALYNELIKYNNEQTN